MFDAGIVEHAGSMTSTSNSAKMAQSPASERQHHVASGGVACATVGTHKHAHTHAHTRAYERTCARTRTREIGRTSFKFTHQYASSFFRHRAHAAYSISRLTSPHTVSHAECLSIFLCMTGNCRPSNAIFPTMLSTPWGKICVRGARILACRPARTASRMFERTVGAPQWPCGTAVYANRKEITKHGLHINSGTSSERS